MNSYVIYKRVKGQREHSSLHKCTHRHFRRQLIMLTTQTVLEMFAIFSRGLRRKYAFNASNSRPSFNLPVLKWIERRDSLICNNPFVTRNWKRSSIDYGVLSREGKEHITQCIKLTIFTLIKHIHSNNDIKKLLVGCVTMDISNRITLWTQVVKSLNKWHTYLNHKLIFFFGVL